MNELLLISLLCFLTAEGTISAVTNVARHFETDYAYHGLAIFDPSNRPLSVQSLYGAALPTPVGHLRECDSYRTDDLRGAQIFSRTPIALNKWTDDLLSIAKVCSSIVVDLLCCYYCCFCC